MKNKKLTRDNNKLVHGGNLPLKISGYSDQKLIKKLLSNGFFKDGKEIFLVAGELDPIFYKKLIRHCKHLFETVSINIIAGPYIAIEDKAFLKYHKVQNNELKNWWFAERKSDWWKAHPIFKETHENEKIKIYITKQRVPKHFLIIKNTNKVYLEEPHDELESSENKNAEVYQNNKCKATEWLRGEFSINCV